MPNLNEKDSSRKNVFSKRMQIGLGVIAAVFIFTGISQVLRGDKDSKPASGTTTSSSTTETAPNSGADYSQVGPKFKDPKGPLALNYPALWAIGQSPTETNPFQASAEGGVVDYRISKEPLSQDITAKEYLDAMDKIFKTDPKIKSMTPLAENNLTVNGNQALTREHTMILTGKDIILKQKLFIVVKDRNAYCAVATTPLDLYEKTKPVFDQVDSTIRFE